MQMSKYNSFVMNCRETQLSVFFSADTMNFLLRSFFSIVSIFEIWHEPNNVLYFTPQPRFIELKGGFIRSHFFDARSMA